MHLEEPQWGRGVQATCCNLGTNWWGSRVTCDHAPPSPDTLPPIIGCGKTSLINILASKVPATGSKFMKLSGEISINNQPVTEQVMGKISAYVTQVSLLKVLPLVTFSIRTIISTHISLCGKLSFFKLNSLCLRVSQESNEKLLWMTSS